MGKIVIKNDKEISIMAEVGKKLARVKKELIKLVKEDKRASDIEELAVDLIKKEGAKPSFMMVPGYHWATCVNVNSGLVHGIPTSDVIFKKGDVVSVDLGLFYEGFHSDSSFTVAIKPTSEIEKFLEVGKNALKKAINCCEEGKYISDISSAIEKTVKKVGYEPVLALSGHGVGRKLHEEPVIPCFVANEKEIEIKNGMTLAIEVMYMQGSSEVVLENDGWTISTLDGKISALYEETVAVTKHGPLVLTEV